MRRMKYLLWLPAALAVLWASCAVRTNDCMRSGSVNAVLLKKICENWGCRSRIFCSMSFAFSSVTPAARLIAAYT